MPAVTLAALAVGALVAAPRPATAQPYGYGYYRPGAVPYYTPRFYGPRYYGPAYYPPPAYYHRPWRPPVYYAPPPVFYGPRYGVVIR